MCRSQLDRFKDYHTRLTTSVTDRYAAPRRTSITNVKTAGESLAGLHIFADHMKDDIKAGPIQTKSN